MNVFASFFVGGLILLSLVFLQVNMNQNSVETTFTTISSKQIESLGSLIDFDFRKIGMGNLGNSFPIQSADSNAITFSADLNQDRTAETVSWKFENAGNSVADTPNPDDYYLIRTVGAKVDTFRAVVTRFRLTYQMSDGTMNPSPAPGQLENILGIRVQLICESPVSVNKSSYLRSTWQKVYTPANLQF